MEENGTFQFDDLVAEYDHFAHPVAEVTVDGKDLSENEYNISISDLRIELSSDFEASIASYMMYNVYDEVGAQYKTKAVKDYVQIGSVVVICLGYGKTAREVFRGFIAKVNYVYERDDIPGIRITAMDIKGIMMANSYAKQFKASSYSGAVKELFRASPYTELFSSEAAGKLQDTPGGGALGGMAAGIGGAAGGVPGMGEKLDTEHLVTAVDITNTPDDSGQPQTPAPGGGAAGPPSPDGRKVQTETTYTVEMVGESDYEFLVKAAKKFNYEFYIMGGTLVFRPAKQDTSTLMTLSPKTMLQSVDVEYDVTGLVSAVTVRNVDVSKGSLLSSKKKNQNKIGNKAKSLIQNSEKVFIDPTVDSKNDAGYRADYLLEDMVYRFGTLRAEIVGLPEIVPGKFVEVKGLGGAVENTWYLTNVTHTLDRDGLFTTKMTGKAAKV